MILYSIFVLLIASLPSIVFFRNFSLFQRASRDVDAMTWARSQRLNVLIPARNEAASIGPAIESILANSHPSFEVLVLDDHSEDNTASIVESFGARDSRVQLIESKPLPENWNGKQHACWQLAQQASSDWLLFLDADVRLAPDALVRCLAEQHVRGAPLISGFPKQETLTWAEWTLIPLMHYVLLCYLPIDQMRSSRGVGLAAGCGQLFLAKRDVYLEVGGHSAIANSRHDGIQLPRAFRRAGHRTDIFDATDIAKCRMYASMKQVCNGLLKNATEGIANARLIVPFSVLLLFGSFVPVISLALGVWLGMPTLGLVLLAIATVLGWLPRWVASVRFEQSVVGAILHPLGVAWFVALQWIALFRQLLGLKTAWRGRA